MLSQRDLRLRRPLRLLREGMQQEEALARQGYVHNSVFALAAEPKLVKSATKGPHMGHPEICPECPEEFEPRAALAASIGVNSSR